MIFGYVVCLGIFTALTSAQDAELAKIGKLIASLPKPPPDHSVDKELNGFMKYIEKNELQAYKDLVEDELHKEDLKQEQFFDKMLSQLKNLNKYQTSIGKIFSRRSR